MRIAITAISLMALVTSARPASSQQDFVYPHGDLTIEISCSACHTTESWRPTKDPLDFDHGAATGFRLDGRHGDIDCANCHLDLDFSEPKLTEGVCTTCHFDVHRGRLSPDCESCHNTTLFTLVDGPEVHLGTSFPLSGAHQQISCESCHADDVGGAFVSLSTDCFACHAEDYTESQFVDHAAANFSTDCRECHTTLAWSHSVSFDHASYAAGFTLLGRHAEIRCSSCHAAGVSGSIFSPSSQEDCFACHQVIYDSHHGISGFPTTCTLCHTNDSWVYSGDFDHAAFTGGYALVGRHAELPCTSCHSPSVAGPIYSPSSQNDCVACHQDDYDDEHGGSGFPTNCSLCHTNDSWEGATFTDHDALFFPIFSGRHQGEWSGCETCHTNPNDFSQFTCFNCHAHNRSEMDEKHREEPGYVYESNACHSCHPNGRSP